MTFFCQWITKKGEKGKYFFIKYFIIIYDKINVNYNILFGIGVGVDNKKGKKM